MRYTIKCKDCGQFTGSLIHKCINIKFRFILSDFFQGTLIGLMIVGLYLII